MYIIINNWSYSLGGKLSELSEEKLILYNRAKAVTPGPEHNTTLKSLLFAVINVFISDAICTGTLGTWAVLRIASSFIEPSLSRTDLGGFQSREETLTYNYHQWLSEFVTQYWFSMYYGSRDI
jgi:hypothetical protein